MNQPDPPEVLLAIRRTLGRVVAPAVSEPYAAKQLALACLLIEDVAAQWEERPAANRRAMEALDAVLRDACQVLGLVNARLVDPSAGRDLERMLSDLCSLERRGTDWSDRATAALEQVLVLVENELARRDDRSLRMLKSRAYAVAYTL